MGRAFKILICDDDDGTRQMLSEFLTQAGAEVVAVNRASKAIIALEAGGVDIAFLDLSMPEMCGDEALEKIRDNPALRHIPIVILTGDEDVTKVSRCLRLGAAEYLVKPVEGQALVNLIRKLLVDGRPGRRGTSMKVPGPSPVFGYERSRPSARPVIVPPAAGGLEADSRDIESARRELFSLLVMVHPVVDTFHVRVARFLARAPGDAFLSEVGNKLTDLQLVLKDLANLVGQEDGPDGGQE